VHLKELKQAPCDFRRPVSRPPDQNSRRPLLTRRLVTKARCKLHANVSTRSASLAGDVGKHVPAVSSTLRPRPVDELREWGGERLVRGKRILDLGCGDGRFALGVAPFAVSVDGLDPDVEGIAAAKKNAREAGVRNARFAVGAAQHLPYSDAAFDVVILSWTL